jgi:MYXO-CTERM domain-containing protein
LIGDASHSTTITIDLGGLYSFVGGFMNYNPEPDPPGVHAFIRALAADSATVLEFHDLFTDAPISTGPLSVNEGAFRGIDVGSPLIRYFQFGGSASAFHDLTVGVGEEVPEPATAFTAAGALVLLGLLRRRRR